MTNLIRRQATALKNFLLKAVLPVQRAFAIAYEQLLASGSPSNSRNPARGGFRRDRFGARVGGSRFGFRLLFLFALLMGAASSAQAGTDMCSGYPLVNGSHIVDGNDPAVTPLTLPSSIGIDADCTFQNFPISAKWPFGLTSTLNFKFDGYLAVFNNVIYTGNMACSNTTTHIWFANGSLYLPGSGNSCQDLFIPIEKIDKKSPAATASVGAPFTYTLTIPVMYAPLTGATSYTPSANDLGNIRVTDDLTAVATGAEMTLVGINAYVKGGGPISVTNSGDNKHLDFTLPDIKAGSQVVVEVTVVLDDDPTNTGGKQFINTANWQFSRYIDGTLYAPLPGQAGISQPMTIAAPNLVVDKSSTVTNLNLNGVAPFKIDVQNTGSYDAWNPTVTDVLPSGMCVTSPLANLSAQIFAADGVTPVSGVLALNTDYTATYSGCTLEVTLKDTYKLAPDQRLIVKYDARFDPGTTPSGSFTNFAGATRWYNDVSTNTTTRKLYGPYTLTDGTPGTADFQDAYTINAAVVGYYLLKSVENRTSGATPSANVVMTANPGDRLRYTLQIQNFTLPALNDMSIRDDLPALIVPGSLSLVSQTLPAGAALNVSPTGGANGTGFITITNLDLPSDTAKTGIVYQLQFDVIVATPASTPALLSNQANLLDGWDDAQGNTVRWTGLSDDPFIGGPARLGDNTATFQPTDAIINKPGPLSKVANRAKATIGEQFTYTIKVPAVASQAPLYDVRVTDDLAASAADLRYISARWKQPDGTWRTLSNGGSAATPVLYDPVTGIDIATGGQAEIEITVELQNTPTNQNTLGSFVNTATYTYNRANGVASTQTNGEAGTSGAMSIVEPSLTASKTVQFRSPAGKTTAEAAMVGDVLEYVVTLTNNGTSTAHDLNVADTLPAGVALDSSFTPTATIGSAPVSGFNPVPSVINGATVWGRNNGDQTFDLDVGKSLILTYRVTVVSVSGAPISNSVYTDWTSLDGASASERTGVDCLAGTAAGLNDYCVGPTVSPAINTLDNTSISKAATLDTYAESPASTTDPVLRVGDTVTYELTLNLQEYTTRNVVVTDVLPQGMALQSFTIDSGATTFNYTMQAEPTAPSAPGATLTWNFGDIYNVPSNNATPVDKLVIRYVAKVVTNAPTIGVDYTTSILRDNTAKLAYIGGDPTVYPARLTSVERIEIRQPAMSAITKSGVVVPSPARTVAGNGAQSSPYQVLVASDTMNFQIRSCNNGLAPAYGVQITDALGSQFDAASISGLTVSANGTVLASPSGYSYTLTGSTMSFTLATPVNPGQCVTVAYGIGFRSDVAPNSLWSNQAQLPQYASLPADGRLYNPTDVAQVWVTNSFPGVTPIKTVNVTEAVVGQEVTYEIVIPAGNAALSNVVISDPLDPRLEFVSFQKLSGPGLTLTQNGNGLSFATALIPAGVETRIQVTARVRNTLGAQAGQVSNTVTYSYTNSGSASVPLSATVAFNIVEPALAIDKSVPSSQPVAGDILTYTLAITASGGTTSDFYSDAHDVIIKDTLGLGLGYVAGSARLNGVAIADPAVVGDGVASNQVLTWDAGLDIAEGSAPVITYQVRVLAGVGAGQLLRNDVRVEWTSLEGASTYERNGTGPLTTDVNDYFDTDFTELTTLMPGAPTKTSSKTTATIGERFSYYVTVPSAGTTAATALWDVQVHDNLAASGADLAFIDAAVDMTGTGSGPWTPLTNSGTATSLVVGGGGFDIPAGGKAMVRITVELRNSTSNNRGLNFNNTAYYTYDQSNGDASTSQTSATSNAVSMTVVEPEVSATNPAIKTVANVTTGKTATDSAGAGDVLQYVVTIPNSGDSTAYDVNVADVLPAGTVLNPSFTPIAKINGVAVPLFKSAPTVSGSNVVWGRGNADETLDIPAGQSLVLTYRVSVISATGAPITNRVYVDWTSLNAASGTERTGVDCLAGTPSPLNDYCYGPVAATLGTTDSTSITKVVQSDDYAESPTSTTDPIVRVGDTVTYDLTLNLQEGTTTNVAVTDVLPQGLALVSSTIVPNPSISYTGPGTASVTGNTVTWSFGMVTNTPSGNNTPIDQLVIRYVARILPDAPNVGVAVPGGAGVDTSIRRDNTAQLSYTGGDPATAAARLTSTERIDVRQPWMSPITKVDYGTGRTGSGTALDPYVVNLVSDTMKFRLSSCNNGLAPAYGVLITDQLALELDEADLAASPVVRIGATTLAAGTDYIYTAPARGGLMQIALTKPVEPTQCVTVEYSVGFHGDVVANSKWANHAALPTYASLPAAGRLYTSASTAQVWMKNTFNGVTPTKTVNVTEAVIGQEVTYEIVIPAPNAALNNVVIDDPLAASLEYVKVATINGPAVTYVAGSNTRFTVAQIPAGQELRFQVTARVKNAIEAQAGQVSNTVTYSYTGSASATVPLSATVAFTIVEPAVDVTKVVSNPTPAIGERLTYTLTLAASGGATYSDARDIKIVDKLGAGLAYVPGSTTGVLTADPVITIDGSGNQVLTWDTTVDITEGTAPTLNYRVDVLASTGAGQTLRNDVRVEWTSLDGASAFERNGTGATVNDLNNYFDTAFAIATTPLRIDFAKSVVNATTGQNPGTNATPGDKLHYRLTLKNTNVVALTNVRIDDVLAAEFAAGTLSKLTVSDAGAVATANPTGGTNGTGLVTVQLATLAAGATLTVDLDATLKPVIQSGTSVLNQASLAADGLPASISNQTSTLISSAPRFQVKKTSADLTGDPNVLRAGDRLRYTIAVQNLGNENATGVTLRDVVPAYTTYVANSTRLNGAAVADAGGVSPLQTGLSLGDMSAVAGAATNVATVTFDVVVNANVLDSTIISNQGFVNGSGAGTSGAIVEQPSDDPATTTIPDDPTRDIVGSLPLLDAQKVATLQTDANSNGALDAGETLRYTITVNNFGTVAGADVVLTDAIPANTSYVPGSVTLNGQPVADVSGASPLVGGLQVGPIAAGANATVNFDVAVNTGVGAGTPISNQGYVASPGLATEPTDADGYDANGDQPTIVLVGSAQQLAIVKEVSVVGGGAAQPGGQLEYVVRVTNTGAAPATQVVLTDDLTPLAGKANYVAGSATLNGSATGVSYAAPVLTANYAATYGNLPAGATTTLRFRVQIDAAFLNGTLANTAQVTWNTPALNASASTSIDIGAIPGSAVLGGHVWHDVDFDNVPGAGEQNLAGWTVELLRNSVRLGGVATDAGGLYRFSGVAPTVGSDQYELRFTAPGATATTAKLGLADSPFANGMQAIDAITALSGSTQQNLNLPIDPNGVVFDSIVRAPIAGAMVTLLNNGTPVASTCFADPVQQNQVTLASGFYKFDLNYSDASCPLGGDYVIRVTPPAGYTAGPSRLIPPVTHEATAPYDVATCSADAVAAPAGYCEAQISAYTPGAAVPGAQIKHYLHLKLSNPLPNDSQLFNNSLAVDPLLAESVSISKTAGLVNVSRGQLVPYTITVNNKLVGALTDLQIVDTFPPGFKYVEGSARIDGVAAEPVKTNRTLIWNNRAIAGNAKLEIKLLFIVGSGVSEGEYINRAQMFNSGGDATGVATATVRVVPDPNFDCTDVIGKVFDDANRNGFQDVGEKGLPGVRIATARGLLVTTDDHGRYHVSCAVVPDENRGSNFILKVDDRTLPTGYRITTENPLVQRVTRGKMAKFNFGATIHKVVRIDVANGVFESDTTEMRLQWKPRMDLLLGELKKAPSTLRLAYMAEVEDEKLVKARLQTLKQEITSLWAQQNGPYELVIETEVFWRTGAPPKRSALK